MKDPFEAKNPGVELRNRVDRLSKSSQSRRIRDRLEEKAKLYDSIGRLLLYLSHILQWKDMCQIFRRELMF